MHLAIRLIRRPLIKCTTGPTALHSIWQLARSTNNPLSTLLITL